MKTESVCHNDLHYEESMLVCQDGSVKIVDVETMQDIRRNVLQ